MGNTAAVKPSPVRKPASQGQGLDLPLVLVTIALAVFGLLMLYSASWDFSQLEFGSPTQVFNRQVLWLGLGTAIALFLAIFNYHHLSRLAVPMILITIGLLVTVLVVNEVRHGATRTLTQGSVQPSELAKLVTIIYLAVWLHAKQEHLNDLQLGLIPMGIILGIIGGLIYVQPDLSATVTIFILGGLLFFLAGGDLKQIVIVLVFAVFAGWFVVQVSPTGQQRVSEFMTGIKDPSQSSYHVIRSLEAIVNGGWFGVGIGKANAKLTGLPVPPTDSIFAVIAEELGVFGAVCLISMYAVLLWRGLTIAQRAPDMLGSLLAAGLTFWIAAEALINMTVMVGLLPFAGNALPFISAGGSNLTATLAAVGILQNVARQSQAGEKTDWRKISASVDLRRWDRRRRVPRPRRSTNAER